MGAVDGLPLHDGLSEATPTNPVMLTHASGHAMQVVREPIREAIDRIAHLYDRPVCVRRP